LYSEKHVNVHIASCKFVNVESEPRFCKIILSLLLKWECPEGKQVQPILILWARTGSVSHSQLQLHQHSHGSTSASCKQFSFPGGSIPVLSGWGPNKLPKPFQQLSWETEWTPVLLFLLSYCRLLTNWPCISAPARVELKLTSFKQWLFMVSYLPQHPSPPSECIPGLYLHKTETAVLTKITWILIVMI
jgi:hypothetical protein